MIYSLENTIMNAYICRINHCEILNIMDLVFDTFYCDVDGFKQINITCDNVINDKMITVLLYYCGYFNSLTNDMLYENSLMWIVDELMSCYLLFLLLLIKLYPSSNTNTSIYVEISNFTSNYSFSYKFTVVITFYCWYATIFVWFFSG